MDNVDEKRLEITEKDHTETDFHVFSKRSNGFHWQAKGFELNFFIIKTSL